MNFHFVTVAATGTQVTSGSSSARTAVPNANDGNPARRVLVTVATASGLAYVKPGTSSVMASADDLCVNYGHPIILNTRGCADIAYLQGTTADKINFTPLEDA